MATSTLNRDAQLSTLANAAYLENPPTTIGSWTRVGDPHPTASGFFGVAYYNSETKQVVVSFRGTNGTSDLKPDTTFATGGWNQQFTDAAAYTRQVQNTIANDKQYKGATLLTTGHSLGGGISQIIAKMFGLDGSSYEAPGASSVTANAQYAAVKAQYASDSSGAIGASFTNYRAEGSFISSVGTVLGNTQNMVNLTEAGAISFASVALTIGGLTTGGLGGLVTSALGVTGINVDTHHSMDGMERTMYLAAGLEKAIGNGSVKMSTVSLSQATGQAWTGTGAEPQVTVFKDANNQVTAYIQKDGAGWKLSTPDQQTTITLSPSTTAGQAPTCTVKEPNKDAYTCTLTEKDGDVTRNVDTNRDGAIDKSTTTHHLADNAIQTEVDTNGDGKIDTSQLSMGDVKYDLFDFSQRANAEYQLNKLHDAGLVSQTDWASFTREGSDWLLGANGGLGLQPGGGLGLQAPVDWADPIGAFYDSQSASYDNAPSIGNKTWRVLGSANQSISAAQLTALDANKDGRLSGAELNGLTVWADANEDGQGQASELTTLAAALANAGLTSLRSGDYAHYTRSNGQIVAAAVADPAWSEPTYSGVPASNYQSLRNANGMFPTSSSFFMWQSNQVMLTWNKGQYDNLIGTDGNDSFDVNYYAASPSYLSSYLGNVKNFMAGAGDDVMGGSTRSDNLWGGTGNDVLYGYAGDDKLYGEEGADELQGGDGNDALDGGIGDDRLFGQVGNDTLWGENGNDVLVGFTGSNEAKQTLAAGETDDDVLSGGAGQDSLYGKLGNDKLFGGADADFLMGDAGNDTLSGGTGSDELQGGTGDDQLDGGADDDKLFGQEGNDTLWGGDGNDVMLGFSGSNASKQTLAAGETDDDVLYGGKGSDVLIGGWGKDRLYGGADKDELQGNEGDDVLLGEAGDDHLFGQVGNDMLYGGEGDDVLMGFTATNEAKQTLNVGESDDDFLYGGAGQDTLWGGLGNDYLDGGAGADVMVGNEGDDVYVVNSVNDVIYEKSAQGYDTVIASTNYLLNANVEELRLLEGFEIHGTGNALNNRLVGNSSDNILDGVTGADTMLGGAGNDTYYVDNVGDVVVENASEGVDTVQSSIGYTLGSDVENLVLLDFSKPEKGLVDGQRVLVYGYPKRNELDYMQGDAVDGYQGTCALTSIANLLTQTGRPTSEREVVNVAINNNWAITDPNLPAYQLGGSNVEDQRNILTSYGLRNDVINGYNEVGIANLVCSGRGVILGVNAGVLWGEAAYNSTTGGANHAVTLTGAVYSETDGALMGFYLADSGRGSVSDMTRFVDLTTFRRMADIPAAYAIYTVEPVKYWDENINGTGNALDNKLVGNRGDNVLQGLAGDDALYGDDGNDLLDGGTGNDTLKGGEGDDIYVVESAGDVVTEIASEGTDTVRASLSYALGANVENLVLTGISQINGTGNALNNKITGNAAANILEGGAGDDTLDGSAGADTLRGGSGNDTYILDNTSDIVVENPNQGNDMVVASFSLTLSDNLENLTLSGTEALWGTGNAADNIITGNFADNILQGGAGSDTLLGGAGNDVLAGAQYTYSEQDDSYVVVEGTQWGHNVLDGGDGDDELYAGAGGDTLKGGAGTDYLAGDVGDDLLDGGSGSDYLYGSGGNDTYMFGRGYGQDYVSDSDWSSTAASSVDTVQFVAGVAAADVVVTRDQYNLYLSIAGTTDKLTLSSWFSGDSYRIEQVKFADGTVWDAATLIAKSNIGTSGNDYLGGSTGADRLVGLAGNDTYVVNNVGDVVTEALNEGTDSVQASVSFVLGANVENLSLTGSSAINGTGNELANNLSGNTANNTLDGKAGNDYLYGYGGNDTYMFGRGYGQDYVSDSDWSSTAASSVDTVQFVAGVAAADVVVTRDQYNLYLSIAGTTDKLTLSSWFSGDSYRIEQVKFADGTVWDAATLIAKSNIGTSGNDYLGGSTGADRLVGLAGNDTYVVNNVGDVVTEALNEGTDSVQASVSFVLGANVENLSLTGSSAINGTGNELANNLSGNTANNTLDGKAGNDYLYGYGGNDTYMFGRGYGQDYVSDSDWSSTAASSVDTVQFVAGVAAADVVVTRDQYNLYLSIAGTTDKLTLSSWFSGDSYRIEQVKFADGTVWDAATLIAKSNIGTSGNDYLGGSTGADRLVGLAGNDTYVVNNVGDVVTEALNEGTDSVQASVSFVLGANVENLSLTGSSAINGTGNELANNLSGNTANNTLDGKAGNDYLYGYGGNDTYMFGRGYGQDYVSDSDWSSTAASSVDTVQFVAGVAAADVVVTRDQYNLYLSIAGTTDKLTLSSWFSGDSYRIEQVKFADGTVWDAATLIAKSNIGTSGNDYLGGSTGADRLVGLAGNDTYVVNNVGDVVTEALNEGTDSVQASVSFVLGANVENLSLTGSSAINGTGNELANNLSGNTANNTLDGKAGNDYLYGYGGNDTYMFGRGYGQDYVSDSDWSSTAASSVDTVQFVAGVAAADVVVTRDQYNLYLSIAGTTDKLTLSSWFSGDSYRIEQVKFADGTVWNLPSQVQKLTLQPTQNDDYLVGTNQNDQIASLGGNDTLYGMEGDDVLQGGAGIDRLYGGAGNDALDGGADNFDFLAGGAGNDRYLLYRGIGQDTIADGDATAGNVDTIVVAPDIAPSDINAFGVYDDFIIAVKGTKDSFVIRNISDPSMQIERMVFSDGTVWDMNTFTQIIRGIPTEDPDALRGTTADDVIDGLGGADVITGLAGNDSLYGSGGDDQIDGGDGNDSLFGGTGNDQLFAGNGDDRLEGNDGADALYGDAGADSLLGGNGDDLLYGGLGNDRLLGGLGNDTYRFFQGIGTDTVVETDSANNLDIVSLLDKGSKDLWFKRTGNNLEVSVLNSTDKVVVENWYLSTNNHIDAFYTETDKRMLLNTNVDILVSAMANYNSIPLSMSDSMNALINQTWTPVL